MSIQFRTHIGVEPIQPPTLPCPVTNHLSLNTPVGNAVDQFDRVWLADTANNRVLIFDTELEHLLASFGSVGNEADQFNMPFRLLAHPSKPWIYVSDIANRRVHILQYDEQLNVQSIKQFGAEDPVNLQGPNGLAFRDGELCVADEFYQGEGGASRLVIFSETGELRREIHQVTQGEQVHHFLWPQGVSQDEQGHLYITNPGFENVVRCDWYGNGVPFGHGEATIEKLDLARGVSIIAERILVPGGVNNAIAIYDLNGVYQGALTGFFAPVQITCKGQDNHLLITEPFLANLQWHQVDVTQVSNQQEMPSDVVRSIGDERNLPGQFHFVTATTGHVENGCHPELQPQTNPVEQWFDQQLIWQENWLKSIAPVENSWLNLTMNTQLEWIQRWQETWLRIVFGDHFSHTDELLWIVDAGNFQLQATEQLAKKSARPASLPLLPGSLGVCNYTPLHPLPGQLDPETPMILVSNFLTGIITLYQFDPMINELVPYTVFGGMGTNKQQFQQPQGMAVDPLNNDILIADSANNRISRWKINANGKPQFVKTFGKKGIGKGDFFVPTDIAIDEQGHRYITDQKNDRVEIYDRNDKWIGRFGQYGYGTDNANFLLPTSVEYDQGYLFVSDLVNRAIKVFTPSGEFVDSFSGFGADSRKGQLWMPYLLHVKQGMIYLPDCTLNRINVYQFEPNSITSSQTNVQTANAEQE